MTTLSPTDTSGSGHPRVVITNQGALRMLSDRNRSQEQRTRAIELTRPFQLIWESSGDPALLREALRDADMLVTK